MSGKRCIGYVRNLASGPSLDDQIQALQAARCSASDIYVATSKQSETGKLKLALKSARSTDVFIVATLTNLNPRQLVLVLNSLKGRNIDFYSIAEKLDTRPLGADEAIRLMLCLLDFMHQVRSESTTIGLDAARAVGRVGGRRYVLSNDQRKIARGLRDLRQYSMAEIAKRVGVSRSTLYLAGIGGSTNRPKHRKSNE
jgi:DNA invertase Pin-like site-specific DNA recombinase